MSKMYDHDPLKGANKLRCIVGSPLHFEAVACGDSLCQNRCCGKVLWSELF